LFDPLGEEISGSSLKTVDVGCTGEILLLLLNLAPNIWAGILGADCVGD
jgi:hypothetical protein